MMVCSWTPEAIDPQPMVPERLAAKSQEPGFRSSWKYAITPPSDDPITPFRSGLPYRASMKGRTVCATKSA